MSGLLPQVTASVFLHTLIFVPNFLFWKNSNLQKIYLDSPTVYILQYLVILSLTYMHVLHFSFFLSEPFGSELKTVLDITPNTLRTLSTMNKDTRILF